MQRVTKSNIQSIDSIRKMFGNKRTEIQEHYGVIEDEESIKSDLGQKLPEKKR